MTFKVYSILLLSQIVVGFNSSYPKLPRLTHQVFYFIDADCDNCNINHVINGKIWVVTNGIYEADWNNHDFLLRKFKSEVLKQTSADSALLKRAVFRFQANREDTEKSYQEKEAKMEIKGYKIFKIDFKS